MNTHILKRLSIIIIAISISTYVNAQESETTNTHNEQVTIISSFDPSINQAYKINTSPEQMSFKIDKPEFTFESLNINQPTIITLDPIKPVVINADKRISTTNNSLQVGVGSLFSPYVDFYHSSGQRNDYRFDAHLYQLSTFKNIKDYSPSPEAHAEVDLNYRKFMNYHIFDAGINYAFKSNRYYGFKPDDYPAVNTSDNRLKQSFNYASLNLAIKSNYSNNKKLNHSIGIDGYYYFDKHKTSESNVKLDFDIHKNFQVTDMLDYQELGLSGIVSYYGNKDSLTSSTDLYIGATPYFKGKYGLFNFHVGLNFNLLNTNTTNFYFYPIIDVNVNLIPDYLTAFAGIDGKVQKHSYLELTDLNPWVDPTTNLNWDRTFTAYGGVRGNFSQKVNYSAQVSWKKFNNLFFFINIPEDGTNTSLPYNKFEAIYDGGSVFGVSGEITYAASEKVNLSAGVKYNTYSLDSLTDAYHKPSSEIKFGISLMAIKKMRIWSEVYYYGKRVALDPTKLPASTTVDLDGFIDLNAGIDYQLTDDFSIFLSLTNILNSDYQRYLNYPVNGIQVMGGLTYKF